MDNIPVLSRTISRDLELYEEFGEQIIPIYKTSPRFASEPIRILVQSHEAEEIADFKLICNQNLIPKQYVCRVSPKCSFLTDRLDNFKRHVAKCEEISQQKIEGKLKPYGISTNVVDQLVQMGYLPGEARNFRKTFFCAFDIESLEDKTQIEGLRNVEAIHKLASISIACNDGRKACFIRKNSSHEAAINLIKEFVDEIRAIRDHHELIMPDYFFTCAEQLEIDCENDEIPTKQKMILTSLKSKVNSYLNLDIYGFNSGMLYKNNRSLEE